MDKDIIYVYYRYSSDPEGDLICSMTKFMDEYLKYKTSYFYTYIYNDLSIFSNNNQLQLAFRVPGATRGAIMLERLSKNQFKIIDIHFNYEECFGEYACYNIKLEKDIECYIGKVLDFSKVILQNNIYKEDTNNE